MQGNHLTRRAKQILQALKIKPQLEKLAISGKGGYLGEFRSSVSKYSF